ncbi:hypothetical protein L9F63_027433, partial [Diploptera punctata]
NTDRRKELGYYKFYTTPETWLSAQETCEQHGANLLVLNSVREFTTIKAIWDTYPDISNIHVGLHDLLEEGSFVTVDGKNFGMPQEIWFYNKFYDKYYSIMLHIKEGECDLDDFYDRWCSVTIGFYV